MNAIETNYVKNSEYNKDIERRLTLAKQRLDVALRDPWIAAQVKLLRGYLDQIINFRQENYDKSKLDAVRRRVREWLYRNHNENGILAFMTFIMHTELDEDEEVSGWAEDEMWQFATNRGWIDLCERYEAYCPLYR